MESHLQFAEVNGRDSSVAIELRKRLVWAFSKVYSALLSTADERDDNNFLSIFNDAI